MALPEDPEEVYYGIDECGTCHAKLDNGKHLCMVDFVSPEHVLMSVFRGSTLVGEIELREGDVVEYELFDGDNDDESWTCDNASSLQDVKDCMGWSRRDLYEEGQ